MNWQNGHQAEAFRSTLGKFFSRPLLRCIGETRDFKSGVWVEKCAIQAVPFNAQHLDRSQQGKVWKFHHNAMGKSKAQVSISQPFKLLQNLTQSVFPFLHPPIPHLSGFSSVACGPQRLHLLSDLVSKVSATASCRCGWRCICILLKPTYASPASIRPSSLDAQSSQTYLQQLHSTCRDSRD